MSFTYRYRARTPSGRAVLGSMRACSAADAMAALRERMLVPSHLAADTRAFTFARAFRKRDLRERLVFFRAYASLEQAGIDFSTAFGLLISQARTARMREALSAIRSDVEGAGEKLWSAMSRRPDEFSDLEVAMVAAGEEAGNREEVFARLAAFLERDERMRKRLRAALTYPVFVSAAAVTMIAYVLLFVVPQFAALFASFDVAPSPALSALIGLSAFVSAPLTLALLVAGVLCSGVAASHVIASPENALAIDRFRSRIPLVGGAMRKGSLARIARVLATLLESGVNVVRALEVATPVAESPLVAHALEEARSRIAGGSASSLDEALSTSGLFPPLFIGFVRIGGAAGTIPALLSRVAEYYEDDVESVLSALPSIVQTAVTIGLGFVVGAIAYVAYVPLTTLGSSIH